MTRTDKISLAVLAVLVMAVGPSRQPSCRRRDRPTLKVEVAGDLKAGDLGQAGDRRDPPRIGPEVLSRLLTKPAT